MNNNPINFQMSGSHSVDNGFFSAFDYEYYNPIWRYEVAGLGVAAAFLSGRVSLTLTAMAMGGGAAAGAVHGVLNASSESGSGSDDAFHSNS